MARFDIANSKVIKALLLLQFIPLLLFPPYFFVPTAQTWWLPALLVLFAAIGVVQIFRQQRVAWPLYLMSFAQGFNIISRLLMLMPQSTQNTTDGAVINAPYLILSLIAILWSALMLIYVEKPEVKQQLIG